MGRRQSSSYHVGHPVHPGRSGDAVDAPRGGRRNGPPGITVHLVQNLERYTLADERFPSQGFLSLEGGTRHAFDLTMVPYGDDAVPRRRGPAKLIVSARDHSWRGLFEGNQSTIEQDVTVKFTPPKLDVASRPLPVSQGGTGVVFYHVSEDAKRSASRSATRFSRISTSLRKNFVRFPFLRFLTTRRPRLRFASLQTTALAIRANARSTCRSFRDNGERER